MSSRSMHISLFILYFVFRGRTMGESCAKFDVWDTFSADSGLSFSFAVNYTGCDAGYPRIRGVYVSRQSHNSNLPLPYCQILFARNGSCYSIEGCRCSPSPDKSLSHIFNVTAQVENPDGETWILYGHLENGEIIKTLLWVGPVPTREPTFLAETTADILQDAPVTPEAERSTTQVFQFLIIIIILSVSLAAAVVVIIVISVIAFCKRQRHLPNQANPRSDDMEMAAVYSQHDADVHHYLALPPNRDAAAAEAEAGDGDGVYEIA